MKSNGPLPSVVYGSATASFGSPPVNVVCSPASGSIFQVGSTTVTCTATDQLQRTNSCTFTVTVTVPPQISLTSFAAYGDSMTNGEVVSETMDSCDAPAVHGRPHGGLSHRLAEGIESVVPAQTISVTNLGISQKTTQQLANTFSTAVPVGAYQALLLMAGANDLAALAGSNTDSTGVIPTAVENMRQMVVSARNRGLRVFVATIPPEVPNVSCNGESNGGASRFVVPYNDALAAMIASQNAALVDVYQAFNGQTSTLIDCDGLHPTIAGYQLIADTFFKVIVQNLQVPSSTPQRTTAQPLTVPARRR